MICSDTPREMKNCLRIYLFILLATLYSCELPWSGGNRLSQRPVVNDFTRSMPAPKARDINRSVDRGEVSEAINRAVDPPMTDGADCATCVDTHRAPSGSGVCRYFNSWVNQGVPRDALKQALTYYQSNKSSFSNQRYLSIADYSQHSGNKRFYLLDLSNGSVTKEHVSHGSGYSRSEGVNRGDAAHDGMIDRCTQRNGTRTNMTRVGFFRTSNFYFSTSHDRAKKGRKGWPNLAVSSGPRVNGMRMVGLSSTNSEALGAGVVMHEAYYNQDAMSGRPAKMGRSYGCPAFLPGRGGPVMDKISNGSLFYGYSGNLCPREMSRGPLAQVPGWQSMCE